VRREAQLRRRIFAAATGAWQEALEALRGTADNGGFEAPKQGVQREKNPMHMVILLDGYH